MKTIGIVLSICSLFLALFWELGNDRKGEAKKDKKYDIYWRLSFACLAATIHWFTYMATWYSAFIASFAIHFAFFDYLEHRQLIKRGIIVGHWFTYLGKTAWWDTRSFWIAFGPWGRFAIKLWCIGAALIMYLYV